MDPESHPVERSQVESFVLTEQDLEEEEEEEAVGELLQVDPETRALLQAAAGIRLSDDPSHDVDPESRARLEKLLEAAGLDNSLIEPDVLRRLTSSVSCALDEAAAALTRMRQEALLEKQQHHNSNHNSSTTSSSQQQPPRNGSPSSAATGSTNSGTTGVNSSSSSSSRPAIVEDLDSDACISLIDACNEGDLEAVRKLLEEGRNVNEMTDEGESLLSLACSSGYLELAQLLLATRANVEDRGLKDMTPLMEAASAGHIDIVKLLLDHGADVNAQTSQGNTPLMYAASGCTPDHETIVRLLLEAGANVSDCNENGHTPLMEAASAGNVEVAKILVEAGASINTHSNEFKESALTLACYKGHLEMVRFLLEAGADQEHKTEEMHTALMEASMDGHVEVARLLLDSGAQVNMPADSFESPLTLAACGGHVELAMLLLERGANIEEVNDEGYTPLMEAAREGHEEMVALLLSQGADINAQTEETQETALTLACCGGFLEVADFLIKAGADIEAGANTPLAEAAQEGHLELVRHLLEAKANVNATSATGDTPLMYACENGHTEVAEVLLTAGADIEHEAEGGRTPLMKAARAGHLSTVQFLVKAGANVNKVTANNDHTPLSLACAGGHVAVVEYLLSQGADPSHRLKDNSTMLIEAAKGGHTQIVQLLIEHPLRSSPLPSSDSTLQCLSANTVTSCLGNNIDPDASGRGESVPVNESSNTAPSCRKVSTSKTTSSRKAGPASVTGRVKISPPSTTNLPSCEFEDHPTSGVKSCKATSVIKSTSSATGVGALGSLDPDLLEDIKSDAVDAERALKETERLEQCINNMMKRTEMLNPSREEQILQKQQILEELQRVERELQSKAQAQLLLSAQATAHQQQQQQQLLQALNSDDPTARLLASETMASLEFLKRTIPQMESQATDSRKAEQPPPLKRIAKAKKKLVPARKTASEVEAVLNQKNLNDSLCPSSNQVQEVTSSTSQQQQVDTTTTSAFPPPPDDGSPVEKATIATTSQSTQTPPVTLTTTSQGGSSLMSITTTLRSESGSTVKLNMMSGSGKAGQSGALAASSGSASIQLPPLTSQQLQVLKKQLADAAAAASAGLDITARPGSGSVSLNLTATVSQPATTGKIEEIDDSSKSSDPGIGSSGAGGGSSFVSSSSSSSSSITGGQTAEAQSQQPTTRAPRRVPPTPTATSVGSQTIVDRNMLDSLRQQYVGKSSTSSSSSSYKSVSINNNQQEQVCSSSSSSSVVSGSNLTTTSNTASSSVPSPPPFFSQSIEIDGQTDSNHDTALTLSCAGGHEELVSLLLSRGANCEHRDKKGFTPLMLAASAGHANVCEILLNHGVDIEAQSERTKDTALSLACSSGRYEVVELLLSRGANKEHRNVSDYTPLSLAASGGYEPIIKLLLQHGAEINSRTGSKLGISPLMLAAMNGHARTVKLLLDMGSDINAQIETNRNTALTLACFQGRCEVVSLLLDRKANVEHRAKTGLTPLMEAASGGYVEVGRILLEKGADVNAPPVPSSRDTALTIAADKGHYRFVELLIKKGGPNLNLDARNKKGSSPLWLAANGGHLDVVQLLVSSGADIDAQDNRKVSCLMSAFRKGHLKVVKWMVKHVTQFPSDQEMTRYLALVNDKELLKKCNQCMEVIRQAKDKQAAEANKNAAILLEELEKEKEKVEKKEESKRKKNEKRKLKAKQKKEQQEKLKTKGSTEDDKKSAGGKKAAKADDSDSSSDSDSEDDDSTAIPAPDSTHDVVLSRVPAQQPAKVASTPSVTITAVPAPGRKQSKPDITASPVKESNKTTTSNATATAKGGNKKQQQSQQQKPEVVVIETTNQTSKTSKAAPAAPNAKGNRKENSPPEVTIEVVTTAKQPAKKEEVKKTQPQQQAKSSTAKTTVPQPQLSREEKKKPQKSSSVETPSVVESNVWTNETAANINGSDVAHGKKNGAKGRSVSPVPVTTSRKATQSSTVTSTSSQQIRGVRTQEDLEWKEVNKGRQKKISVPSSAISRVIGRGGCNINAVREYSGAHIEVEKQKGSQQADRQIIIKGSSDATKNAFAMINALVNEPDKELIDIVAELGIEEPVKETEQTGDFSSSAPRVKSGSVSVPTSKSSTASKTSTTTQPMSQMIFSSSQMQSTTTTAFSASRTSGKPTSTTTTPFATNWTNVTSTSSIVSGRSANTKVSTATSSPAKHPASSTSPDVKTSSSSPFSSVRPSSQPFPSKSPAPISQTAATSTTTTAASEYTPFTNTLFGKVGASVWGPKDQKLNFAAVARGSAFSGGPSQNQSSVTGSLSIQASTNVSEQSPPMAAEPSKAPGFRGNFVSPSSSTVSPSIVTSTSAPGSPPIVSQIQQPSPDGGIPSSTSGSSPGSGRSDPFRSHESSKPAFNLAPGSRSTMTSHGSPSSSQHHDIRSTDNTLTIDEFRNDLLQSSSSVQSSLNPNAQSYAPDPVTGLSHQVRGAGTIGQNIMRPQPRGAQEVPSAQQSAHQSQAGRPTVPFESLPNPQLQMQMRAAILAAGVNLQMNALQQQHRLQQQQQQQQQVAQAAALMGGQDFPPPSAETLRMLQTALQGAAAATTSVSGAFQAAAPVVPSGLNTFTGHQAPSSVTSSGPIGPPRRKVEGQDPTDVNHLLDESKSFPRPIGTERAQKKNPIGGAFGINPPGLSSGASDLWQMSDLTGSTSESDWLNAQFSAPPDHLVANLLQTSLSNPRAFESGFVDPTLDPSFQFPMDQAYATPSSGLMANMMNGGMVPPQPGHHGLGAGAGFSMPHLLTQTTTDASDYWAANQMEPNSWKPLVPTSVPGLGQNGVDATDHKSMQWHTTTSQASQHHQSWNHHP